MTATGMTIDQAVDRACEKHTLAEALTWIAVWAHERVKHGLVDIDLHASVERVLQRYPAIPRVYEECARECDAQADALAKDISAGDHDRCGCGCGNLSSDGMKRFERVIGRRQAYRAAAAHLRDLGRSAAARATAASTLAGSPSDPDSQRDVDDADLLLARIVRARNRILDLRDEYVSGSRDVRRLGQGVVGALMLAIEAVSDGLDEEQIARANAERAKTKACRGGFFNDPTRPTLIGAFVRIGSVSDCEIHDSATEGLPKLIHARKAGSLVRSIRVCAECYERTLTEAERERQATVP